MDTKTTNPTYLYRRISGVFQRFQRYKMHLCDNVSISDTSLPQNVVSVLASLSEAEFDVESIPIDTMLSPEFDGIDLSGGQWQRLAIARGLYRTNEFIVLDEPTAAIDPIEEARIYSQFKHLVKDKCATIVTHRNRTVLKREFQKQGADHLYSKKY